MSVYILINLNGNILSSSEFENTNQFEVGEHLYRSLAKGVLIFGERGSSLRIISLWKVFQRPKHRVKASLINSQVFSLNSRALTAQQTALKKRRRFAKKKPCSHLENKIRSSFSPVSAHQTPNPFPDECMWKGRRWCAWVLVRDIVRVNWAKFRWVADEQNATTTSNQLLAMYMRPTSGMSSTPINRLGRRNVLVFRTARTGRDEGGGNWGWKIPGQEAPKIEGLERQALLFVFLSRERKRKFQLTPPTRIPTQMMFSSF